MSKKSIFDRFYATFVAVHNNHSKLLTIVQLVKLVYHFKIPSIA